MGEKTKNKFNLKLNDESTNLCLQEQKLSLKCLDDNDYDKTKCTLYFKNYNNCRIFWDAVYKDRFARQIYPLYPEPKDREKVKAEYAYLKKTLNFK